MLPYVSAELAAEQITAQCLTAICSAAARSRCLARSVLPYMQVDCLHGPTKLVDVTVLTTDLFFTVQVPVFQCDRQVLLCSPVMAASS